MSFPVLGILLGVTLSIACLFFLSLGSPPLAAAALLCYAAALCVESRQCVHSRHHRTGRSW